MNEIVTPDQVITALVDIRERAEQGIETLYEAEVKLAELQMEADRIEATAIVYAQGTTTHKEAVAKLKSAEARFEAEKAKAEYARIKAHLRQLELAQSSVQTQARMVEISWRQAGLM